ncbi:MAG TPA: nitrilase family protein [Ginsengibacter sp.]
MDTINIATAQFEHKSGDKNYNLKIIERLSATAAKQGAVAIAFHECSITGYTFARQLSKEQLLNLSEYIAGGESVKKLTEIAAKNNITILAGLFERDKDDKIFKAYICVDKNGLIAKHRKLHPFIHPAITPGNTYTIFDLDGWKCGILICYDNNIIENVRATNLLGADIIFMPHVTMCTPSPRPGAGFVDPALWKNKDTDPASLRREFNGLKGREWLMKWLPARAFDNGLYAIFSNAIGMDDDQLKNGCSMIIDPFGDVIAECENLDDDVVTATLEKEKLTNAGGYRYRKARRPELYKDIIGKPNNPEQKVAWLNIPGNSIINS